MIDEEECWQAGTAEEKLARLGKDSDLDKLVHSKNVYVRMAVADQGRDKDLDILVDDPEALVRLSVADWNRDKDLDILVNDPDDSGFGIFNLPLLSLPSIVTKKRLS